MTDARQTLILQTFTKFEGFLRLSRWRAIDDALESANMPELSSTERDEVDLAAACGLAPFQHCETSVE
jgi:hypothetical protein